MPRHETFGYKTIDDEPGESSGEEIESGHRSSHQDSLRPKPIGTPRLFEQRDRPYSYSRPSEDIESLKSETDTAKPVKPKLVEEPPYDFGD